MAGRKKQVGNDEKLREATKLRAKGKEWTGTRAMSAGRSRTPPPPRRTAEESDYSDSEPPSSPEIPLKTAKKQAKAKAKITRAAASKKKVDEKAEEPDFTERDDANDYLERVDALRDDIESAHADFEDVQKHLTAAYKALRKIIDKHQTIEDEIEDEIEDPPAKTSKKRKAVKANDVTEGTRKSPRFNK